MQQVCVAQNGHRRVDVAGVRIDAISLEELLQTYEKYLKCSHAHVTHHVPAHPLVEARSDEGFADVLQRADLNLPDGMGVVWAARLMGVHSLRERLYGPTVMLEVLRWGLDRGLRHAFVGGSPRSLDALERNLCSRFPGLRVEGTYAPPMREVTPQGVEEDLRELAVDADILWVGLSTPKQQRWAELARPHTPAKILSTVGAAFDFHAGTKAQAPVWMQRSGLEWTFRLATEPRRLWRRYLLGNPQFVWAVLSQRRTVRQ